MNVLIAICVILGLVIVIGLVSLIIHILIKQQLQLQKEIKELEAQKENLIEEKKEDGKRTSN